MTRRITLVVVAGLAVLAMTASAAFAQSEPLKRGLSDFGDASVQSTPIGTPDAVDRAAAANQVNMLDAREKAFGVKHDSQLVSTGYPDWFERAAEAAIRNSRSPVVDDRFRLDSTTGPAPVSATSSGREIEWPQIGFGLGLGIVLMLGLYLAVRYTRIRPLAH